ncbi:hypothetical protein [Palleronia pelagia]|uniref:Uncharacterized protein n=1 Tax=Palleronia pelagia TaxID=387096 RepID=A0A1H8ACX3_9RHOB|nr:hypothetical protein [Palleronia pelagia]SEM67658.1 hypothetical protein SAMN04488011_10183 [Palleronia pelagia]
MHRKINVVLLSLVALPTVFFLASLRTAVALSADALSAPGLAAMMPVALLAALLVRMILKGHGANAAD